MDRREKFSKYGAFHNTALKVRLRTPSSDGEGSWIEARPANQMSQAEKDRNAQRAREERKLAKGPLSSQSGSSRIPLKREPAEAYNSDPESSDDKAPQSAKKVNLSEVLKKKSKLVKDSLMNKELDDYDPLFEKRVIKLANESKVREDRILARQSSGEVNVNANNSRNRKRIFLDSDDEEEAKVPLTTQPSSKSITFESPAMVDDLVLIDTPQVQQRKKLKTTYAANVKAVKNDEIDLVSDNNDDEENENDYSERDYTARDLQEKALQVVKQCERVGANLRRCLKEWENSSSSSTKPDNNNEADCVNLVHINKDQSYSSGSILSNEDIAVICPELTLNPYQLVGVNWLKLLYENNINGVLADDMGLGKTVQTIAFLGWLFLQNDDTDPNKQPTLIVVPASTLANWDNELARFCPQLVVVRFHGSQAEKEELRYELRKEIAKGKVDVILTTYTLFERESGKVDRAFLLKQEFNYLILDEAHSIKNASSSRYANLNQLQTQHRLLLSGTPVQNDLSELLALLSFLMPKVFGREDCEAMMAAFSMQSSSSSSSSGSIGGVTLAQVKSMLAPFVLRRLKRDVLDHLSDKTVTLCKLPMENSQKQIYNDIILAYADRKRRLQLKFQASTDEARILEGKIKGGKSATKAVNAAARKKKNKPPEAVVEIEEDDSDIVDLISPSAATSSAANETVKVTEIIHLDELNDNVTTSTTSTSTSSAAAVVPKTPETEQLSHNLRELTGNEAKHLFTALRKAANHPLLLRVHYQDDSILFRICQVAYHEGYFGFQVSMDRAKSEIEGFSDFDIHQLCLQFKPLHSYALDSSVLYDSPKMKYLQELLPSLQELGHRMLLFSQWTRLLDLLEVLLNEMNMPFLRLDGSTPIKERQELIDTFNENYAIPVFLLSTKAGGLGINLTAADTVILHDLDFNPENDKQAEDRCHRIGQTKPVTIYKLIAVDTVDEDIFDMGERKRHLSEAVLSDARSPAVAVANGSGNGKASASKSKDDDELTVISRILSKALKRQGIQL